MFCRHIQYFWLFTENLTFTFPSFLENTRSYAGPDKLHPGEEWPQKTNCSLLPQNQDCCPGKLDKWAAGDKKGAARPFYYFWYKQTNSWEKRGLLLNCIWSILREAKNVQGFQSIVKKSSVPIESYLWILPGQGIWFHFLKSWLPAGSLAIWIPDNPR